MRIAMVDYRAGNVYSLRLAFERLGCEVMLSACPDTLSGADAVLIPGVGAAGAALRELHAAGLGEALRGLTQPVLGVCVGLQLMCRHSAEDDTPGLGIFDLEVTRFEGDIKVPHMGWNAIENLTAPLFEGVAPGSHVYFANSYRAPVGEDTCARTDYAGPFSAALARDNFHAVQFHPEKSAGVGIRVLQNFLSIAA